MEQLCGLRHDIQKLDANTFAKIEEKITQILRDTRVERKLYLYGVSTRISDLLSILRYSSRETIFLNQEQLQKIVERENASGSAKFSIKDGWIKVITSESLDEKIFTIIEKKITRILRFSGNIQRGEDKISVKISDLLGKLKDDRREAILLSGEELQRIVEIKNASGQNKFSIKDGWIRVNYGHSTEITRELFGDAVKPPDQLFYLKHEGEIITKENGIKPYAINEWLSSANCVYLISIKLVVRDFKRKNVSINDKNEWKNYVQIDAKSMYENGVKIIKYGELYMVKFVDGSFIKFL